MHGKPRQTKTIAFLMALTITSSALAAAPTKEKEGLNENWASFWDDCYDLNLPYFQSRIKKFVELLKAGDAWEQAIEVEKIQIDKLNNETCKNWSHSRNGEEALKELTTTLMTRATTSNDLAARGTSDIGKQLEAWMAVEQKELDEYGFKFGEFPCGKGFERTKKLVEARVKDIIAKAETIKAECNKSIEKAMAEGGPSGPKAGVKQTYGKGSGKVVPKGTSENGASDISGVKESIEDEKLSEEIIRKQEAEAAEKNKKKKKAGGSK